MRVLLFFKYRGRTSHVVFTADGGRGAASTRHCAGPDARTPGEGVSIPRALDEQKPSELSLGGLSNEEPDSDLLSPEIQPTIIGAEAFHCPVRNGKEWDHPAMAVRQRLCLVRQGRTRRNLREGMNMGCEALFASFLSKPKPQ